MKEKKEDEEGEVTGKRGRGEDDVGHMQRSWGKESKRLVTDEELRMKRERKIHQR